MKAARIHGLKSVSYDTVDDPIIEQNTYVILKVTPTAICGSDLHIYSQGLPQPRPMVLGHQFMSIVEEVDAAISNLKRGDRVVAPYPIACGGCYFSTTIYQGIVKTLTQITMVPKEEYSRPMESLKQKNIKLRL